MAQSEIDQSQIDNLKIMDFVVWELNQSSQLEKILANILIHIKKLTNIEAMSIRLHKDGDFPYYVYDGFNQEFILQENSLCSKDENNNNLLEPNTNQTQLECMCGNVIRGRTDPKQPFFSINGSFWSNHISKLLANTTEKERQSKTRNHCNSCGYESVALIPIRANEICLGLLQLDDHRKNLFTPELIELLEKIGEIMGLKIMESPLFTAPTKYIDPEHKELDEIRPICSHCKNIKNLDSIWEEIEDYLLKVKKIKFTHSICPICQIKFYEHLKK